MKETSRTARRTEIETHAYALLDKGEDQFTMQALAKSARASMETLYRWYGDRQGLFAALVEGNAAQVTERLDAQEPAPPMDQLAAIGPELLAMVTGPRAIALNRAATADRTGQLGAALAKAGRETVAPRIARIIAEAQAAGDLGPAPVPGITETYLALLIGDLQIRVATRAVAPPDTETCANRGAAALAALQTLYPG